MDSGHRASPHDGSAALEARGPDREACIRAAVTALMESIVGDIGGLAPDPEKCTTHAFRIPVPTPEAALVAVLEEALYVLDMTGRVPVATSISGIDTGYVTGSFTLVDGREEDLAASVPKGISLAGLVLTKDAESWRCRFVVDA